MPNLEATKSENVEQLQQLEQHQNITTQILPNTNKLFLNTEQHIYLQYKNQVQKKLIRCIQTAIKDANIDKERYNNDPNYFVEINKTVMKNFNESFLAEIDNAYTPKVQELTKKLEKLEERNSRNEK